ncbi:uncharacterized protein PHALS_14959 [Plasmopara halstedii]|uniref:Uncharacterized protein n=1 Tax=Plasmopara halstedii TaxID=4781 RepID=A0A0P1AZN6_PLAHL|nr:uncharacterized protein PHALS_14959 [Plasmopara halstedii]CEG47079.1 hypothetical protein PHALS_14959 [Plasmopara halstedii]|eukprot:XP_024583448.1 hypothetical protein PHALS_14959 [Plasmopara halstedii]
MHNEFKPYLRVPSVRYMGSAINGEVMWKCAISTCSFEYERRTLKQLVVLVVVARDICTTIKDAVNVYSFSFLKNNQELKR